MISSALINRQSRLAVLGLGYVGLPVALAFAKKIPVVGFDINEERIKLMQQATDPSRELSASDFENADIIFTSSVNALKEASFYIVAVPTPVDEHKVPDISLLLKASKTVGQVIKPGDYVVFESTVYPGCTEEDCVPVIEKLSGLKAGIDFKVGYSPERINPGDKKHTLENVVKVVSGSDEEAAEQIAKVYSLVVKAGVFKASSIKVAEAAKVIENTQRDLNIALMNELSIIFDKMNISTSEVLEAAGTKWNFLRFYPGLVGGHCIGVDPYYLTYKASELGYISRVVLAGRHVNDAMGNYVAKKVLQHIIKYNGNIKEARILVLGATFKENVTDIRNSKVADVVENLESYYLNVEVYDPNACSADVKHEYGFELVEKPGDNYDAVIIAVSHDEFCHLGDAYFAAITKEHGLIADLKGIYRNKISKRAYWSL
ncbi:nucleotide sugar dehydrogenase [Foetidibacter luteolus]|uniref:nucleotide sugar dehydrogenase n=1 Tax=Foetidibacter luteolus TaxID=2608880 RepID=UPI001F21A4D7|nr:nucleotide sugar dehydrogenase [Foetidibacter luteolus]